MSILQFTNVGYRNNSIYKFNLPNENVYLLKLKFAALFFLTIGGGMSACAISDSVSWKEEVLLHDGNKIIVERSQIYGGRHEIGQSKPVAEHIISFKSPATGKEVKWRSEYGDKFEKWGLLPLALEIINGVPYMISSPHTCVDYNKWARPNPPYVVQKYDGLSWGRDYSPGFPSEFTESNLIISAFRNETQQNIIELKSEPIAASQIKKINSDSRAPHLKYLRVFERKEISLDDCPKLYYHKEGWSGDPDVNS